MDQNPQPTRVSDAGHIEGRFDATIAWVVSLAFHCSALVVLMLFTRPALQQGGPGEGEVGIYLGEKGMQYDQGSSDFKPIQFAETQLSVPPPAANTIESLEISDLNLNPQALEPALEALIGIEAPTNADGDSLNRWSGYLAGSGAAKGGTTSFFGLKARGSKFVYVVDCSGSMSGRKLLAAKAEIYRSINAYKSSMKFYIFFYNSTPIAMPGKQLIPAVQANKTKAFNWVEHITTGGGTQPAPAVLEALKLKPDAIWLLSDGLFSQQACDEIRQANSDGKVQIHTIAFHDNHGEAQLKRIAQENRGKYRFVQDTSPRRRR
jgi:VWA domain-containing protein